MASRSEASRSMLTPDTTQPPDGYAAQGGPMMPSTQIAENATALTQKPRSHAATVIAAPAKFYSATSSDYCSSAVKSTTK